MSITSALNNALSGLNATSKLAEITAGNLANALTDGYGRQAVSLSGTVLEGHGTGVVVSGVDRAASPELTSARRIADGDMAGSQAEFDALVRLESSLGGAPGATIQSPRVSSPSRPACGNWQKPRNWRRARPPRPPPPAMSP
jgi:flagellar hook-associated protein 1 FlgK